MGKFLFLLFSAIALSALLGVDYVSQRRAAGPDGLAFRVYASMRTGGISDAFLAPELTDMAAPAPYGWNRTLASVTDIEALTGRAPLPGELAAFVASKISGSAVAAHRYQGAADVVLVGLQLRPAAGAEPGAGIGGFVGEPSAQGVSLGEVGGVEFRVSAASAAASSGGGDLRLMTATLGSQIDIAVMTNASDERTLAVLRGINFGGLNRFLAAPDPAIAAIAAAPEAERAARPKVGIKPDKGGFGGSCQRRAGSKSCVVETPDG